MFILLYFKRWPIVFPDNNNGKKRKTVLNYYIFAKKKQKTTKRNIFQNRKFNEKILWYLLKQKVRRRINSFNQQKKKEKLQKFKLFFVKIQRNKVANLNVIVTNIYVKRKAKTHKNSACLYNFISLYSKFGSMLGIVV